MVHISPIGKRILKSLLDRADERTGEVPKLYTSSAAIASIVCCSSNGVTTQIRNLSLAGLLTVVYSRGSATKITLNLPAIAEFEVKPNADVAKPSGRIGTQNLYELVERMLG